MQRHERYAEIVRRRVEQIVDRPLCDRHPLLAPNAAAIAHAGGDVGDDDQVRNRVGSRATRDVFCFVDQRAKIAVIVRGAG
jgi:hypothetical protein